MTGLEFMDLLFQEFGVDSEAVQLFDRHPADFNARVVLLRMKAAVVRKIAALAEFRQIIERQRMAFSALPLPKAFFRPQHSLTANVNVQFLFKLAYDRFLACLSQLYHEYKRGIKAGYAKYETFPIWNLPLKHPVNLAYEAATADLNDVNMIDPFHLEAYGQTTINYNRDVEIFPVLSATFEKIMGDCPYKSPTDMGVNMNGFCIIDDEVCRQASRQEIIRRYYSALCQKRQGNADDEQIYKLELLMKQAGTCLDDRPIIAAAKTKAEATGEPAAAMQLPDGRILTGKTSSLLGATSALLLNALKVLAGIDDEIKLISPEILSPIQDLKVTHLGNQNPRLHTDELLIALSICAVTDEKAKRAIEQLQHLKGSEVHSSVILAQADMNVLRKLGINLTCEPTYQSQGLYHP